MAILNLTSCGHCKGKGKCQCDECQRIDSEKHSGQTGTTRRAPFAVALAKWPLTPPPWSVRTVKVQANVSAPDAR